MSDHPRLTAWIDDALPRHLPDFLPARRWFGGKARAIAGVEVEDAVWLAGARRPCALVIAGVRYADGGRERYSMVLAFGREHDSLPLVGRVEADGGATWAVEAATDPDAALALLRGFSPVSAREWPMLRGGTLRYADAGEATARALAGAAERSSVRPVGAEQSNTSLRLDGTLAFKLFRRLEEGENPELEVGRFLATRTSFRAMPILRGSLTYASPGGASATVGVLQDWVDSRGDGWRHVVELLGDMTDSRSRARLLHDLRSLGATTAEFHAALAADATVPAFAPEPATPADVEAWRSSLLERASRTFQLVARSLAAWPDDARRRARAVLPLQARVAALVPAPDLRAEGARFLKIRIHGDYHLGQTLKTDEGFVLIDFEGEPARPLAERRRKECCLRDVAGMLRSFDYAAGTVRSAPDAAAGAVDTAPLRRAFLEGYLRSARAAGAAFLPADQSVLEAWIACFEMDKALYEVEYEINNRPAWVHLPLGGILGILGASMEG